MKVAICISGFLRIWKHTRRSFIDMLTYDLCDCDIFIHTYNKNLYECTAGLNNEYLSDEEIHELFKGLNVKALVIEDRDKMFPIMSEESKDLKELFENYVVQQRESSDPDSKTVDIGVRTYDHLRKIYLCNELRRDYEKKTGIVYDIVVKTRFDILYLTRPKWENFMDGRMHCGYGATWGYPEDTFCATTPGVMDNTYACRFKNLRDMPQQYGICAHGSLKYMIEKNNVEIGEPAVNILCFRSTDSVQYNGNYRFNYNMYKLYEEVTYTLLINKAIDNIYEAEKVKAFFMLNQNK